MRLSGLLPAGPETRMRLPCGCVIYNFGETIRHAYGPKCPDPEKMEKHPIPPVVEP